MKIVHRNLHLLDLVSLHGVSDFGNFWAVMLKNVVDAVFRHTPNYRHLRWACSLAWSDFWVIKLDMIGYHFGLA